MFLIFHITKEGCGGLILSRCEVSKRSVKSIGRGAYCRWRSFNMLHHDILIAQWCINTNLNFHPFGWISGISLSFSGKRSTLMKAKREKRGLIIGRMPLTEISPTISVFMPRLDGHCNTYRLHLRSLHFSHPLPTDY